jgi:hypothetical protein
MNYILMHKTHEVAEIHVHEQSATIIAVGEVFDPARIPVGSDAENLNDWWRWRSIPASRQHIREALMNLGVATTEKLLTKCLGLSLSDQYWINPIGGLLDWREVNFFDNPFSEDVGAALFGEKPKNGVLDFASPDSTSDGWLQKKWVIAENSRILIKGGSDPFQQEPANEAFASLIMERLGINHIPYAIMSAGGRFYSACENFVTSETDLVSALQLHNSQKQRENESRYEHIIRCAESFGMSGIGAALDKMIVLDYLIINSDRHHGNFGFIRNADTLEWLGMAPIYDSGTSMCHDKANFTEPAPPNRMFAFRADHEDQIKLVKDFSWLDLAKLDGVANEFHNLYGKSNMSEQRREALCGVFLRRAKRLEERAASSAGK